MPTCIAYDGARSPCGAPAIICDAHRVGRVCRAPAPRLPPLPRPAGRAHTPPPGLVVPALAGAPVEDLAQQLSGDGAAALCPRLCSPPRPERWAADVARLAEGIGCDPQ